MATASPRWSRLLVMLGVVTILFAATALAWAGLGEHHDNQRNWAFAAGSIGLASGVLMLLGGAVASAEARRRRGP